MEIQRDEPLQWLFIGQNYVLLIFLLYQSSKIFREDPKRAFLHPAVLASALHFGRTYLLPNTRFFDPSGFSYISGTLTFVTRRTYEVLSMAMWAVLLAAIGMWIGYRSAPSIALGERAGAWLRRRRVIRTTARINFAVVALLILLSLAAFLVSVRLGVFGYSAEAQSLTETNAIRGWLYVASNGGSLSLLVLAVAVHTERFRRNALILALFVLVLIWQVVLGFLSGFKSQVVIPALIVAVVRYAMTRRLPIFWLVLGALMLGAAFQVVDSFRTARHADGSFDATSVKSIAGTVVRAASDEAGTARRDDSRAPRWYRFVGRSDLFTYTSEAIAFEQAHDGLPRGAPNFAKSLYMAPINAYVPRVLWPEKESMQFGRWFYVRVLGRSKRSHTAVAMGPVGFLNFAGGFWMVLFGFTFIGMLQRIVWESFKDNGVGGLIAYLSMVAGLAMFPSNLGGFLAGFLRTLPFILIAQYFVLRSEPHVRSAPSESQ